MGSSANFIEILVTTEYCQVAALALVAYDWLVCLPSELTHIWPAERRKTMATMLYIVNRYATIISLALPLTTFFPALFPTLESCVIEVTFATAFTLAPVLTYPALHTLRVYTLSNRNKVLSAITFAPSLFEFIMQLVQQAAYTRVALEPPPFGCSGFDTTPINLGLKLVFIEGAINVASNILVIYVTWRNTKWATAQLQEGLNIGASFSRVMLYHGSVYFLVFIIITIVQTLFSVFNLHSIDTTSGYPAVFLDPIESLLLCRFLLGLQETAADLAGTAHSRSLDLNFASATGTGTSTAFPHFIASMGNSVHNDFGEGRARPVGEEILEHDLPLSTGDESGERTFG